MTQLEVTAYSVWTACQVAKYRRAGNMLNALQMLDSAIRTSHSQRIKSLATWGIEYKSVMISGARVVEFKR